MADYHYIGVCVNWMRTRDAIAFFYIYSARTRLESGVEPHAFSREKRRRLPYGPRHCGLWVAMYKYH